MESTEELRADMALIVVALATAGKALKRQELLDALVLIDPAMTETRIKLAAKQLVTVPICKLAPNPDGGMRSGYSFLDLSLTPSDRLMYIDPRPREAGTE